MTGDSLQVLIGTHTGCVTGLLGAIVYNMLAMSERCVCHSYSD